MVTSKAVALMSALEARRDGREAEAAAFRASVSLISKGGLLGRSDEQYDVVVLRDRLDFVSAKLEISALEGYASAYFWPRYRCYVLAQPFGPDFRTYHIAHESVFDDKEKELMAPGAEPVFP
jgi:hypothetical protein